MSKVIFFSLYHANEEICRYKIKITFYQEKKENDCYRKKDWLMTQHSHFEKNYEFTFGNKNWLDYKKTGISDQE
jgi:hypothetical protein